MNNGETNLLDREQETAIEEPQDGADVEAVLDDEPINLEADDEPETDDDPDAEPEGDAEGEADDPDGDDDEWADIEIDGKSYKVPAELKEGYMKSADYTRKTQEVAEMRRAVEAKQASIDQVLNISNEEMAAKAHLMNVDQRLQQFANADWRSLEAEDPIAAQSLWREFQMLKEQRGETAAFIQQKAQERSQIAEQETAKRIEETRSYAQKNIKGWSPELDNKITEFAATKFPMEQLVQAMNPQIYEMLHLAYLGSQAIQRQQSVKSVPAVKAKPLQKVNAKANPTAKRSLAEMDMDEYAATRMKQMGYR